MQYQMQYPTMTLEEGKRGKEGGGRKEGEEGKRGREDLIGHGNILSSYPCKGHGL